MGYMRGNVARARAVLGDAWGDYISGQGGPPNGRITSPNGDIVVFDETGHPDYTIPAPRTDATVDKDANSAFYGWTELQKAALVAAQGGTVLTDDLRAKAAFVGGSNVASYSAADVAANQAKLVAIAQSDPTVAAALQTVTSGGTIVTPGSAAAAVASQARSAELLANDARVALAQEIAAGALFTDRLVSGATYSDSALRGLISTDQWIADFIAVSNGGQPTNALAAAGKLPASVASHTYAALPPSQNPTSSTASGTTATATADSPSSGDAPAAADNDVGLGFSLSTPVLLTAAAALVALPLLSRKRKR